MGFAMVRSTTTVRSPFSVTGLAMGLAAVPTTTTVPVTVLCNGPDKGLGRGVTRDESSVFRPLETGLARGFATFRHGAKRDYSSGCSSL
jgi:hypothetical protein